MSSQPDWSPLFERIAVVDPLSRARLFAGLGLGAATGVTAAQLWLQSDPLVRMLGVFLLLMAPPLVVLVLSVKSWNPGQTESCAAMVSLAAVLAAWVQSLHYLSTTQIDLWVWPASFIVMVIVVGAFETIVSTVFVRVARE